jgi:hypothetical protein
VVSPPVSTPQPYQAPSPPPYRAPPPAPAAPAQSSANWGSVEVQPGEVPLGSWTVAIRSVGPDVTGRLTVTDRRILFKPQVAGTTLFGMLLSQRKGFKDQYTLVLPRDKVASVHSEKGMINTKIVVTTVDNVAFGFIRGLLSSEPILAALQPR